MRVLELGKVKQKSFCILTFMNANWFWIVPFVCFLAGYQAISYVATRNEFPVPSVVGLPLTQAIKTLSDQRLNVRIVREQEDPDLPTGTVISQNPRPRYKVKPQQAIFIVITKKVERLAPACTGKKMSEIEELLRENNIRAHTYRLASSHPVDSCFGQWPAAGQAVDGKMTLYVSSGEDRPIIFPALRGQPIRAVMELLKQYHLTPQITHRHYMDEDHICVNCLVAEQRPLPGSLIDLSKPITVALEVE